ncbi:MAG: glycine--tRNA ligase [bacterium]
MAEKNNVMEKITSLCKRRGFIYPASEIYGGFANTFDYGPMGSQLKKNVKDEWWRHFVTEREDIVGLDSAIIQNPRAWEASGHLSSFTDPMVECKSCHGRFRIDKIIEEASGMSLEENFRNYMSGWWSDLRARTEESANDHDETAHKLFAEAEKSKEELISEGVKEKQFEKEYEEYVKNHQIQYEYKGFDTLSAELSEFSRIAKEGVPAYMTYLVAHDSLICTKCKNRTFTFPRDFNLMFKTYVGPMEESSSVAYLRPETAQGIFLNFKNVIQSTRVKVPFGIAQIGKAFRNEITPGNFTFRTLEFEQGEIEFFVENNDHESKNWYKIWLDEWESFFLGLGLKKKNLTRREHSKKELSHYSSGTADLEYNFPFGVSELAGVAQRTDFDLTQHELKSGQDLKYFDEATGKKYLPFVVEPTMGIDRAVLAFIVDAYDESDGNDGRQAGEVTLRLHPRLAPTKVAVFPLVKKEGLPDIAKDIITTLRKAGISTFYDESASVGRRYRRQDEVGTPWCITVDFDTLNDQMVTLRDRDTMAQERVLISDVAGLIQEKLNS